MSKCYIWGVDILILVCVGASEYKFDRLLKIIDELCDEKIIEVLHMIKESDAQLLSPDINRSQANTTINGKEIVIGLNLIDKVSDKVSNYIIKERKKNGDFKSFEDFCQRIPARQCNKRVKENLINAGAFDNIPITHEEKEVQSRLI